MGCWFPHRTQVPAHACPICLLPLHYLMEKRIMLVFKGYPLHWRELAVVFLASKAKVIHFKTVVYRSRISALVDIKSPRGGYSVRSFIHNLLDAFRGSAYGGVECSEQLVSCRANIVPNDAKTELVKSSIHSCQCWHASLFFLC